MHESTAGHGGSQPKTPQTPWLWLQASPRVVLVSQSWPYILQECIITAQQETDILLLAELQAQNTNQTGR